MSQPARPNFLVIITDQMRADHMGCAGNPVVRTPNLDRLAASGTHMPRAYVNCPLCMPSRSTLFTGLTPRGHGVRTNGIPLDRSIPTMTGALAGAGYRTASIGKIHLTCFGTKEAEATPAEHPEAMSLWRGGKIEKIPTPYYGLQHVDVVLGHNTWTHGDWAVWLKREHPEQYQRYLAGSKQKSALGAEDCGVFPVEERFHYTPYIADKTAAFLNEQPAGQPFFLMCSMPDPHHPYKVTPPYDTMYSPDEVIPPVAREGELDELAPFFREVYERGMPLSGRFKATKMSDAHRREIIAHTYGMVTQVDHYIGRVLDALSKSAHADNTIVVFFSDHGDLMGDHGLLNKGPFHFEGLLRVPMIWQCPGTIKAAKTQSLASLLDFAPTVLDFAGVPVPEGPTGHEAKLEPPAWPGRSLKPLLTGTAASVQDSVVIENDEDYLGLRLRTLVTERYKITTYTGHRGAETFGELFDLREDPGELRNLWHRAEHAALKRELVERLHYRLVETDTAVPRRMTHA